MLYAPGLLEVEPVRKVCSALKKPVNVLAGLGPTPLTVEQLAAAGVRRISVGGALSRAALGAVLDAAREIKAQGTFGFASRAASFKDISAFMLARPS